MQDLGENLDGNLPGLTQKTEDPKSNKESEPHFHPTHSKCELTEL